MIFSLARRGRVRFGFGMSLPAKPFAELVARFAELLGEVTELKQIVAGQRDEIGPKRGGKRVKRRRRGKVTPRVAPETEVKSTWFGGRSVA